LERPVIVLGNLALVAARILAWDIARGAKLSSSISELSGLLGAPKAVINARQIAEEAMTPLWAVEALKKML
jgi:hypothetical protein